MNPELIHPTGCDQRERELGKAHNGVCERCGKEAFVLPYGGPWWCEKCVEEFEQSWPDVYGAMR